MTRDVLLGYLRTRVPALVVLAIAFTVAFAAASELLVTATQVPQAGRAAGTAISCQVTPITVGYQVDHSTMTATAMTVSEIDEPCEGNRLTLALDPGSRYFGGVNYAGVDLTSGAIGTLLVLDFSSGVDLTSFTTGAVTVVIESTAGVTVGSP